MNNNSLVKVYNNIQFISYPKLDKLQWYIYVILNNNGDIKIGRSHDIISRMRSLSNSNAGGSQIVKVAVSPPTYLRTYEGSLHDLYNKYRVPNSEWFKGLDFDIVVNEMEKYFNSEKYKCLNDLRKQYGGYRSRNIYNNKTKKDDYFDEY